MKDYALLAFVLLLAMCAVAILWASRQRQDAARRPGPMGFLTFSPEEA